MLPSIVQETVKPSNANQASTRTNKGWSAGDTTEHPSFEPSEVLLQSTAPESSSSGIAPQFTKRSASPLLQLVVQVTVVPASTAGSWNVCVSALDKVNGGDVSSYGRPIGSRVSVEPGVRYAYWMACITSACSCVNSNMQTSYE